MQDFKIDGNADLEYGTGSFRFTEKSIRLGFIRKVYTILSVQLLITLGFIALFLYTPGVKEFSAANPALVISAAVVTLVAVVVLSCFEKIRRRTPWNFIILIVFTLCESLLLGSIASFYTANEVLLAAGVTAAITLGLTLFALQTKWDFTTYGGLALVLFICLLMFGLLAGLFRSNYLNIAYACLGALLFGFYLVIDTQFMMGGKHKYQIEPEEYIFAALNLYLDIINIFLYILAIIGGSNRS